MPHKHDFNVKTMDEPMQGVITDCGQVYTTYEAMARAVGYPSAADSAMRSKAADGMSITILATAEHPDGDLVYLFEDEYGCYGLIGATGVALIPPASERLYVVVELRTTALGTLANSPNVKAFRTREEALMYVGEGAASGATSRYFVEEVEVPE